MMWLIALIFTVLVGAFVRYQGGSWVLTAIVVAGYLVTIWAISSFGY